ncbi:MAG: YggS family pyridoxal phosphate-dependent enzyme [Bacteroidota bacterium]
MSISENLDQIKKTIPTHITLVVVSKTQPISSLLQVYQSGHKVFGENKVQELMTKQAQLPADMQWHMLGHLQTNKVKYIAPFVSLIHSVDSLKLLKEINRQALQNNRTIQCLLEFHIAHEQTKFGLSYPQALQILNAPDFKSLHNIQICGLMGMATFTQNQEQIRDEFKNLHTNFHKLKDTFFADKPYFKEISMGMSSDYILAIQQGATIIRIGTAIFGQRNYL